MRTTSNETAARGEQRRLLFRRGKNDACGPQLSPSEAQTALGEGRNLGERLKEGGEPPEKDHADWQVWTALIELGGTDTVKRCSAGLLAWRKTPGNAETALEAVLALQRCWAEFGVAIGLVPLD